MKGTIRSKPVSIGLLGILGIALALSLPKPALAAGSPEAAPMLVRGEGYLPGPRLRAGEGASASPTGAGRAARRR